VGVVVKINDIFASSLQRSNVLNTYVSWTRLISSDFLI